MVKTIRACAPYAHMCMVPSAQRRFKTPKDPPGYCWEGKPSIVYGVLRRIIHILRLSKHPLHCRVLYTDAGRQGDPWGGFQLILSGQLYHFNAGLHRYPHLIGPGRVVTEEGNRNLANGIPGFLGNHLVDWRWVQDELDITPLFSSQQFSLLETIYAAYESGEIPLPMFQSRSWSAHYGVPLSPNGSNCTVFHARVLKKVTGMDLHEYMPLDLFNRLARESIAPFGFMRTSEDCVLHQLLALDEDVLMDMFAAHTSSGTKWKEISNGVDAVPESLTAFVNSLVC